MAEMEWIIEQEVLPSDSQDEPDMPPEPRRPLGRFLWPSVVLALSLAAVGILWRLGGRDHLVPDPDPLVAQLEAAVELELQAYVTGDQEILAQLQDRMARPESFQPPLDAWVSVWGSGTVDNRLRVLDTQVLNEDTALAQIELVWNGAPYRLTWLYRWINDHWQHTAWVEWERGPMEKLTSAHVKVVYPKDDLLPAAAMLGRVETFTAELCRQLDCPPEPFAVNLEFNERRMPSYHVYRVAPLDYELPSPVRIRWPMDGSSEPILLGSIGRQLAYDLYLQPRVSRLTQRNSTALTLATFWWVHHVLDLDLAPGMHWLEEAVAMHGREAAVDLIDALSAGVVPEAALEDAFGQDTTRLILSMPDYFSWQRVVMDPADQVYPRHYAGNSPAAIRADFDQDAAPWSELGAAYERVTPAIERLTRHGDWVIGSPPLDQSWQGDHYFHLERGVWVPREPDDTLIGEQRESEGDVFAVTYYEWDAAVIPALLEELDRVYQAVGENFGRGSDLPITVLVAPSRNAQVRDVVLADIYLPSPGPGRWEAYLTGPLGPGWELASFLFGDLVDLDRMPEGRILFLVGLLLWQMDELDHDTDAVIRQMLELPADVEWQPPQKPESADWLPLADLWSPAENELGLERAVVLLRFPMLIADYVSVHHGADRAEVMLEALATARSMNDWILTVTGGTPLDEFEPAWRAWVTSQWASR